MNKRRMLSSVLALLLVITLLPVSAGATGCVEVRTAAEMMQELADTPAHPASRRAADAQPTYVLMLGETLPETCGAQRVLHYAAYDEYVLEYASRSAAEAGYRTLTEICGVERCWLDTPEQGASVMDEGAAGPMAANSWGATYMNLTAYRNEVHTSAYFNAARPVVAIIDSGVDPENGTLAARSYRSYDFVNNSTALSDVTTTGNARGHGTRVASILDSVLPEDVRFMYLRVFDDSHSASRLRVLTAIQYAAENGADVLNLSLGWEDDLHQNHNFLNEALREAYNQKAVMVCAAGNSQQNVERCYPANSTYTLAISAVSPMLRFESRYSNWGEMIDFCAPGSGITATTYGGSMVTCTGTSFSAPHITAAVAELKILEPEATPERVRSLLRGYAQDLGDEGKDNYFGWGIPVLPAEYPQLAVHVWDGGRTTRLATATEEGQRVVTCTVCGEAYTVRIPPTGQQTESVFVDVPQNQYYAAPVVWATANYITTGVDSAHFNPSGPCTRAQVVTFLWRMAGSPAPRTVECPFRDVARGSYYHDAVLWAVENGITNGTSPETFSPERICVRAQAVTFLWRFDQAENGKTEPAEMGAGFTDVPENAYYAEAVAWAVRRGITNGTTPTTFGPNDDCTRAQVVTFLFRYANRAE